MHAPVPDGNPRLKSPYLYQVASSFNTLIMLRAKEGATAEMLTKQLPNVEFFSLMQVSVTNDTADPGSSVNFTSRNEDRISVSEVALFTPADIVTLPKGQAFALLEGANPGSCVCRSLIRDMIRRCRRVCSRWPPRWRAGT